MNITNDIVYIGVNDYKTDLFEGQYKLTNGISYNSYAIIDEKTAIMDSVDIGFTEEWLGNIKSTLGDREPDYLVIQHMEPDHSASITAFKSRYPNTVIVASAKAFTMMNGFFKTDFSGCRLIVGNGDKLSLGRHELLFISAPMVHWPEVIVTYDSFDKVLFSADGFGKFGALDIDEEWAQEARRYYFGIVAKYGAQVQSLLKNITPLDIQMICPLHGPVLRENIGYYLDLYDTWSSYKPEEDGVLIAYTSVYGNTKRAVDELCERLACEGVKNVVKVDLARCDMAEAVADAFRYSKTVLATTSYNGDVFPFMREFISQLTERNLQNRKVAFIENGSWAPCAAKIMKEMLLKCKNISYASTTVRITSSPDERNSEEINTLVKELLK